MEYTRKELIEICEMAIVPEDKWNNRDSCSAHEGVGRAWAFLKAGVPYKVLRKGSLITNDYTIWLKFTPWDFGSFEYGKRQGNDVVYLPTKARIESANGADWYCCCCSYGDVKCANALHGVECQNNLKKQRTDLNIQCLTIIHAAKNLNKSLLCALNTMADSASWNNMKPRQCWKTNMNADMQYQQ